MSFSNYKMPAKHNLAKKKLLSIAIGISLLFWLGSALQVFSQSQPTTGPVAEVNQNVKGVETTIRILNRLSSSTELDDEALVGARVKYQSVINSANDIIRYIDEQSKALAARLTEIGPPPDAEGAVEANTVTETRAQLNRDKSTLAVTKTDLEKIILSAQNQIAAITKARQEAFKEAISKRTDITSDMLNEASSGIGSLASSTMSGFSNWFNYVIETKLAAALGSTFVSLAIALFLSFNFNRFFGSYQVRRVANPDYFTRVFSAFWGSILPSAATAIFLFVTYSLFSQYGVLSSKIAEIMYTLFAVISGMVFAWHFCREVFEPESPQWRLVKLPDSSAKRMFWLTVTLFAIYAFDSLFTTVNSAFSGALSLTVLQGVIAAVLIGLVLILIARVIFRRKAVAMPDEQQEKFYRWDKWISFSLSFSAVIIIISALLGYIGFARFLAQQIVVTGGIIAIMTVGILAAREMSREGVMASTRFGQKMLKRGNEAYRVEQVALAAGLALIAIIFLIGIPAILMQWGTRFEEITAFGATIFTGFTIGGFRLSLSGLLIGIFIFALIVVLTRLIQSWLARSVFPRSKIDPGVSDSIKAGIGYVGFAVAALMAVTSAGLDLSSLAIVAGALSLGIGFGLQNIVSNFVSGLILLVERPIKVGDWIIVGAAEGTVKRISVRATEIETFQRQSIIVPNSELINSQVGNWTFKSRSGRVDVNVGISYGSDARLAEKILLEIAHEHAMVTKKPEPNVWFVNFGNSSLDFRLRMFLYDISNLVTVETEVRFEILRRFKEANIEIPFPQQDVNLTLMSDTDKDAVFKAAAAMAAKGQEKTKVAAREKNPTKKSSPKGRTAPG